MNTDTKSILKMVLLQDITIGKTNPRKAFDEDAINELTTSVKEKGVIQPILLRPGGKDGSYELVCGERRFRASQNAGIADIPAYIRELSDDEALELQITENLQRKDVHPMEEAYAFKQLLERHTPEEVAARVGKKEYFIKQRMKLNDLLPEWQKLFYKNLLNMTNALNLAVLPVNTQKEMLKDSDITKDNIDKQNSIRLNEYRLRSYSGDLNKAPFDRADTTLDKKAGPCISCQFNSAVANLFPDAVKSSVCSNISCYKHKCDVSFDQELKKALEDPAIVFISSNYYLDDKKIEERLQKEKHTILRSNDYNGIGIQIDDIEDYVTWCDGEDEDDYNDETEMRAAYDRYVSGLENSKQETDKKIASGKYLKAFIVDGNGKGLFKYIEIRKKAATKDSKKAVESGKASAADIDNEISRIRDRQKRNAELDAEKVHKQIVDAMSQDKSLKAVPAAFTTTDRALMLFLICQNADYSSRDQIKKVIGTYGSASNGNGNCDKLFTQLEAITDEQLAYLVRTFIFQKFKNNLPHGDGGYMVRKLAELLGTIPIAAYETEQQEKAAKRQKNVEKRIAELQQQKKDLKPKPEAKPKTPTKKAAKK